MAKKKKKKMLVLMCILICSTAMYAGQNPAVAHTDVRIPGKARIDHDLPQSILYDNLGPPTNQYNAGTGSFVAGPSSPSLGQSQSVALPLASASVINKVVLPIQYYGDGGDNYVRICVYTDAAGLPGTQLKCKSKSGLPAFGTTNAPTTFNFSYTIPGGSAPVWIVAQEPSTGTGADSTMVWDAHISSEAVNVAGSGWFGFVPDSGGALRVTGQP